MADVQGSISDTELTAYLDGEADATLQARIDAALAADDALPERMADLSRGTDLLAAAYSLDRLDPPAYRPVQATPSQVTPQRFAVPAALAASFVLGLLAMQTLQPEPTWVDTVASYQALYVTDTLTGTLQPPAVSDQVLQTAQASLGVDLRTATEIPGLDFKRAQLLAIEGQPLVQMAYLDDQGNPFAFCAVLLGDNDADILSEMNHGLAAASWVQDGVGFVLIGGDDVPAVTALSEQLQQVL